MIERQFVTQKLKEYQIQEFITSSLSKVGHSHTKMLKTPLGEKIVIYASRPGLIVGRKGANIKDLTKQLKRKFDLENPQIEINEVENIFYDANIVAEMIAGSLERFGSSKFKGVGHKMMSDIMGAGALGVELVISGKLPSSRAKSWRFYQGYLKKCGDIAETGVNTAYESANLKSGTVGIQVRIMPPDVELPDKITLKDEVTEVVEEIKEEKDASEKDATKEEKSEKVEESVEQENKSEEKSEVEDLEKEEQKSDESKDDAEKVEENNSESKE
jgi:small subunit ribosomal protein S3